MSKTLVNDEPKVSSVRREKAQSDTPMSLTNPSDAMPYVNIIRLFIGGYGAYSRERKREDDVAVREEVSRAATRARNHLNNVHDAAYRAKNSEITSACARAIEEVDALKNDVEKAATGGEHPFFSIQKSASKSIIKKLIKHDHDTLTMLKKAVNKSNEIEQDNATGTLENSMARIAECQQLISSCRGHFSERSAVLKGMR